MIMILSSLCALFPASLWELFRNSKWTKGECWTQEWVCVTQQSHLCVRHTVILRDSLVLYQVSVISCFPLRVLNFGDPLWFFSVFPNQTRRRITVCTCPWTEFASTKWIFLFFHPSSPVAGLKATHTVCLSVEDFSVVPHMPNTLITFCQSLACK